MYRSLGALLLACSCCFAAMTFVGPAVPTAPHAVPAGLHERWRPELAGVRTVDEAMRILPDYAARERGSPQARTAAAIDRFVRERFFHGGSEFTYAQNWLAYLAGALWIDLRIPVIPDDILQHRRAICSQQAIVFMELLKRHGIAYASVLIAWPSDPAGASGHFAVAARVDGRWLYFDPDQEVPQPGVPIERVMDGSALPALYGDKPRLLADMRAAAARGQIRLAHVNAFPAPRGGLFQLLTKWLSAYGWLLFGLAGILMASRGGRSRPTPTVEAWRGRLRPLLSGRPG
ncbi:MAG TPA: transglutaminase-like domain-containing protein [Allosphingosinicella sp.]